MQNAPAFIAVATVLGGAYLLLSAQQGSGGGAITTDDTQEGSLLDLGGIMGQIDAATTSTPDANPSRISYTGLQLLKQREGFSATPYADHKGYSIGYGHLIKAGENLPQVTIMQAEQLLANDVEWAENAVSAAITVDLNQAQFDALVSFAYNVGEGAFKRSTLVRRINAADPGASQEFNRWVYASGVVNSALVTRRASEKRQYESGTA